MTRFGPCGSILSRQIKSPHEEFIFFCSVSFVIVLACSFVCGCGSSNKQDEQTARSLLKAITTYCQEDDGSTRPVEAISAMAAIVGERCIDAAGEFKVREHSFVPGQRIFSDKINELLCGDNGNTDINGIPSTSVFGILRDRLANGSYAGRFPEINAIFSGFASRIGKPEDWGKVPLSLSNEFVPHRLPLRVAFDTRSTVDQALKSVSNDKVRCLRISTIALAMVLNDQRDKIAPESALSLALETVNGMGKTAPMKDEAIDNPTDEMKQAQHEVVTVRHKSN